MEANEKIAKFKKELDCIQDERIRESACTLVGLLPDYYFREPASSTGKYHPRFSLGEGGLVRHVKCAVKYAVELFNIYKFDSHTKDLIIFALIIHDGVKKGIVETRYTKFNHPLLIADFIKNNADKMKLTEDETAMLSGLVASHMGKWNTNDYEPGIILPLPKTPEEKFVHMCDFLSSRKFIDVSFDCEDNVLE